MSSEPAPGELGTRAGDNVGMLDPKQELQIQARVGHDTVTASALVNDEEAVITYEIDAGVPVTFTVNSDQLTGTDKCVRWLEAHRGRTMNLTMEARWHNKKSRNKHEIKLDVEAKDGWVTFSNGTSELSLSVSDFHQLADTAQSIEDLLSHVNDDGGIGD